MISLTYDLSKYAFNINICTKNKPEKYKRNRSKSCVEGSGSNNIPIAYVGENDNKNSFEIERANSKKYNTSNALPSSSKYSTSNTINTSTKYNNKV